MPMSTVIKNGTAIVLLSFVQPATMAELIQITQRRIKIGLFIFSFVDGGYILRRKYLALFTTYFQLDPTILGSEHLVPHLAWRFLPGAVAIQFARANSQYSGNR